MDEIGALHELVAETAMSQVSTATNQPGQPWFVTTHWSVVLSAKSKDSPQSGQALETLCREYWYPLYAYVRRQGHNAHDAQDLTQGFFARLLQTDYLKSVAPERGRFRTFLLVALKRFLANEWDRSRAQKRGGGQQLISLDTGDGEARYGTEPAATLDAERIYDRRWAMTLLDRTMSRLRQEFEESGHAAAFERLKGVLTADRGDIDYGKLAAELGQNEGAARVAVHRLRRRFREIFRELIAHTVAGPEEIEEEARYLLAALSD